MLLENWGGILIRLLALHETGHLHCSVASSEQACRHFELSSRADRNSRLERNTIRIGEKGGQIACRLRKKLSAAVIPTGTWRSSPSNIFMVKLPKKSGFFLFGALEVPSNTQFHHQAHVFLPIFSRRIDFTGFQNDISMFSNDISIFYSIIAKNLIIFSTN